MNNFTEEELAHEIWVDLKDGSRVSNLGRFIYPTGRMFKSRTSNNYKTVKVDGKQIFLHRLVAKTFIPNPENKKEVNHINSIKSDNRVSNLEWVTRSENQQHSCKTGLRKCTTNLAIQEKILRLYEDGKSAEEIADILDFHPYTIIKFLKSQGYSITYRNTF